MNYIAIRAVFKIWTPIAKEMYITEQCDAQYDSGEWSGSAHANCQDIEYDRIVNYVAGRFGINSNKLDDELDHYQHDEYNHFYTKLMS